jgi:hypothetical protein
MSLLNSSASPAARPRRDVVAVRVGKVDHVGGAVEQRHVGNIGLEQCADLLADQRDQCRQVELARQLARHGIDRVQFGGALVGLRKEARVFHGHRGGERQSREEFEFGVLERLAAGPPYGQRALDRLAGAQRRHHHPFTGSFLRTGNVERARVVIRIVDILGAAAGDDGADDALTGDDPHVLQLRGAPTFRDNGPESPPGAVAVLRQEDRAVVGDEKILGVMRDAVHDRGQVERGRDVAAHLGQRGGLAHAALVLVEKPRILQRHAHAGRHGGQQPDLGLAERVLAREA